MTDELFEIPVVLSPRLKWMKLHRLKVMPGFVGYDDEEEVVVVRQDGKWVAEALTEDAAIVKAAKKLNLKLWNEA